MLPLVHHSPAMLASIGCSCDEYDCVLCGIDIAAMLKAAHGQGLAATRVLLNLTAVLVAGTKGCWHCRTLQNMGLHSLWFLVLCFVSPVNHRL